MTLATMADRSLPLPERVALAMLRFDMDDAHQEHRRELVADVAAALGGSVIWGVDQPQPLPPHLYMGDNDGNT